MNAKSRRKLDMGKRALAFSRANPDMSPGYTTALNDLEARLIRSDQIAEQQRNGLLEVRAATARKFELRRTMQMSLLDHLEVAARRAASEVPELAQKLVLSRDATTYQAFRTAAGGMAAEAAAHKEVLVKFGLTDTVLERLNQSLAQFDEAMERGTAGRRAHMGASAELRSLADDVVQIVSLMKGLNAVRFASDSEKLGAWEGASNVFATPRTGGGEEPATDEVEPSEGGMESAA